MSDRSEFQANRAAGLRARHEQRLARAEVQALVKVARVLGRGEAAQEIAEAVSAHAGPVDADIVRTIALEIGGRVL